MLTEEEVLKVFREKYRRIPLDILTAHYCKLSYSVNLGWYQCSIILSF